MSATYKCPYCSQHFTSRDVEEDKAGHSTHNEHLARLHLDSLKGERKKRLSALYPLPTEAAPSKDYRDALELWRSVEDATKLKVADIDAFVEMFDVEVDARANKGEKLAALEDRVQSVIEKSAHEEQESDDATEGEESDA